MSKPHIKRLHIDELKSHHPKDASRGVEARTLSLDPETGATTNIIMLPPGWKGSHGAHYHESCEDVYILSGDVTLDQITYTAGCYLYRPAGIVHSNSETSNAGCLGVFMFDAKLDFHTPEFFPGGKYPGEYPIREIKDGRGHIKFLDTNKMEWQGKANGIKEKVLSLDKITGASTFLMKIPPGWHGSGLHFHNCTEEVFVIEGVVITGDGTTYSAGCYACRPPMIVHGRDEYSPEGALLLFRRDGPFDFNRPEELSQEEQGKLVWE